ncbi:MAG: 2-oxoglutarate and iron-dependent oxygenase domain-containing protein [Cytophagales bacterium]|nr:2-oxoglutarate and iron-dependent oxygenase domain-containing protein [Cytophagales bacterium]
MTMFDAIPSLDLHDFIHGTQDSKAKFVADLGKAFHEIGFVAIKNHGLTDEQTKKLYDVFKKFFAMDDAYKSTCEIPGLAGQRGYTGKRKEHAKGQNVADLKEFYQIGQPDKPKEAHLQKEYPDNVWPSNPKDMDTISLEVYKTLENTGIQLLRAIAIYLRLEDHYFDAKVLQGNSILRAIHYFPILDIEEIKKGAIRAGEHEDINLITLLMGASADGLEILRNDGKWIAVTSLPEQIVVNVGDMLSRLTNDTLKSTTHRVVNPKNEKLGTSRFSMPFFMHPRADMDLSCLPGCVTVQNPKKYTDITAGAFLDQRLREIGLKK